jgi:hypothetical protein
MLDRDRSYRWSGATIKIKKASNREGQSMPTLTLKITPELEQLLLQAANQQGIELEHYALALLQQRVQSQSATSPVPTESDLLQQINLGLSPETWQQYELLIAKRQSETLTPDEHQMLIAISDRLEKANARRMEALIALANRKKTSVEAVMGDLGIEMPSYV